MHETVECRQVHEAIRGPLRGRGLAAELLQHVSECPACAELVQLSGPAGPAGQSITLGHALADAERQTLVSARASDFDAMFSHVEQQLSRPPGLVERVREASTRSRGLALFGIASTIVALATMTLSQIDAAIYPLPQLLGSVAALIVAALAAGAVVLRPIHRSPLPGWLLGVLAGFAVITPAVIASVPTVPQDHPSAVIGTGEQLFAPALSCFAIGMTFALLLVGATWLIERSGLRRRSATVLGLVGAGALGNLVLVLHCPIVAPAHRLLGHASISAVLLAVAAGVAFVLARKRR
jgi:hypothetical protein